MDSAEQLAANLNQTSGAAQQLAEAFVQASRAAGNNATAASDAAKNTKKAGDDTAETLKGVGSEGSRVINSFTSVGASVYGAEKAFDSLVPVIDAMAQNTASAISLLAKLATVGGGAVLNSVPGVSKAMEVLEKKGFKVGKAFQGLAEVAGETLNILSTSLKFSISAAQKVTDNFLEASKVGATFSGSLEKMGLIATTEVGIPLQDLSKIITGNVEAIGNLGLGMTKGGTYVAGMAKKIYNSSDALVGLYGNVQNLAKGTAEYMELQTQLGIDVSANAERMYAGATEYLLRQKELSAITGKTAETMKREEEGRRKQLDYNLKLGRLGEVAKANVQEGMLMAGKIFGDQGAKYAEEYFATGGKVYSQEALRYQAMNQEAADTIGQFMTGVDTDAKSYRDKNGKYLKDNAASLEGWAKSLEDMAEINRNANNPLIKAQTETASSILQNLTLIKESTDIFAQVSKDREKLEKGEVPDAMTKIFVDAERQRSELQREIDRMVIGYVDDTGKRVAGTFDKLGDVVKMFNELALLQIKVQETISDVAVEAVRNAMHPGEMTGERIDNLVRAIEDLVIKMTPFGVSAPANTNTPAPSVPQRADGGVTSGPTIAGENGAEAIIPLKNGAVPLKVDLSQLVMAMSEQTQLTKEVIKELQDSNDLTKKLIDYTT